MGWHFPDCLFYLCVCLALWDSELLPRCLFVSAFLVFKLSNTVLGSGDSFEGAGNLTPLPLGAACTWIWVVPSRGCIYLGVRVWRLGETGVRGRSRDCVGLKPGEPAGACIWGLRPLELEDFPILGGLPGPVHKSELVPRLAFSCFLAMFVPAFLEKVACAFTMLTILYRTIQPFSCALQVRAIFFPFPQWKPCPLTDWDSCSKSQDGHIFSFHSVKEEAKSFAWHLHRVSSPSHLPPERHLSPSHSPRLGAMPGSASLGVRMRTLSSGDGHGS